MLVNNKEVHHPSRLRPKRPQWVHRPSDPRPETTPTTNLYGLKTRSIGEVNRSNPKERSPVSVLSKGLSLVNEYPPRHLYFYPFVFDPLVSSVVGQLDLTVRISPWFYSGVFFRSPLQTSRRRITDPYLDAGKNRLNRQSFFSTCTVRPPTPVRFQIVVETDGQCWLAV